MVSSLNQRPVTDFVTSWQYLVNWLLAVILGLAFVFYFARLVGYIISLFLSVFLWKRQKVRVTIGAFRIAPLGGRIMARNVVISTSDYTISILRLNLTWRYWLLRMTRRAQIQMDREDGGGSGGSGRENEGPAVSAAQNKALPTSLVLHIDGLEVFMYNRTVAYENIEETLRKWGQSSAEHEKDSSSPKPEFSGSSASQSTVESVHSNADPSPSSGPSFLLQILPLETTIKRGAFVLGNHTTPSILVASFRTAKAVVDIAHAPSKLDLYRTTFDMTMDRFQVHMKPNITYDPEKYLGQSPRTFSHKAAAAVKRTFRRRNFKLLLAQLRLFPANLRFRRRPRSKAGVDAWHGLKRYVGDSPQDRVVELTDIEEYAKYSLLVDSVTTNLVYYYDVPGVHSNLNSNLQHGSQLPDAENSPQTGVELVLSMATIHYGSWADRQRGPLQQLLFPSLARDARPTNSKIEPGSLRQYAGFRIHVATKNELILRVPTREFSKDKEELATSDDQKQNNTRPFGWLELKLAGGSTFTYFTSYIASLRGWENKLAMKMADLEVRTSVTHGILFSAKTHTVDAQIGFPLAWNGECTWHFDMSSEKGRFFFLREHITLFTDMVADFGSGPPVKYEYFRPFTYHLAWEVRDFRLYFNVNDHNIINDPLDFDSNKYICFCGPKMDIKVKIPLRGMFAASSTVDYNITAPSLELLLEVPPWHTANAFLHGNKKMGSTDAFEIAGAYTYYNKVELDHNNFAVINITGDDVVLLFHGYFIRYLFTFRENYFGDFVNFITYEEYILSEGASNKDVESGSVKSSSKKPDPEYWKLLKAENDLNVLFTFKVRKGMIVLPCQVYDHAQHISLRFDYLDVEIHLCQFYMDLQADFSTGEGYYFPAGTLPAADYVFNSPVYDDLLCCRSPEIIIDTFSVHTHRMLGIDDLTYQCKWDFASDLISIDGSPSILSSIDTVLDNFILGYLDLENSLTYEVPIVYDAANFSFRCPEIRIRLHLQTTATFLEVDIDDLLVSFNDIANFRYSSRISLLLPRIIMRVTEESDGIKYLAYLETSLHLTNFCQKLNMKEHRDRQHEHVRRNDATTHRASFLLYPEEKDSTFNDAKGSVFSTISLPMASFPLTEEYLSMGQFSDSRSTISTYSDYSEMEESSFINGDMYPTINYLDEDYKPLSRPDNQFKNDSFILKFDAIKACICPDGLNAFSELVVGSEESNIDVLLDKLQCGIMKELKHLILPVPMIDNVRVVSTLIDLRIVQHSMVSPSTMFSASQSVPVLTLAIVEPSLVIQKQKNRARLGSFVEEVDSVSFAAHINEIYASVSFPDWFSAVFSGQVSGVEAWFTKNDGSASVASVSLNSFKATINENMLPDVVCFVKSLLSAAEGSMSNFKMASEDSKRWKADLIYLLCRYATENKNISDPEVITKPARILRSKRDHVRFYEAWKIMTKLRSIANEIPSNEGKQYSTANEAQRAPLDALSYVKETFGSWRTWEGNMKEREGFFNEIFADSEDKDRGFKMLLTIISLELNLSRKGEISNYVAFSKIDVHATKIFGDRIVNSGNSLVAREPVFDIALSIDAIDSALSMSVFPLLDAFKNNNTSTKTEVMASSPTKDTAFSACEFSALVNLNSFRFRLNLDRTYLELTLEEFTSSIIGGVSIENVTSYGWASKLGEAAISFGRERTKCLSLVSEEISVVASGTKEGTQATLFLESNTKNVDMKLLHNQNALVSVISDLMADVNLVMKQFPPLSETESVKIVHKNEQKQYLPKLTLIFVVEKFSFLIEALHPLKIEGVLGGASSKVRVLGSETFIKYAHKTFTSDIVINETSILRSKSSDLSISSLLTEINGHWLVKTDARSDYFKVVTPSLLNALEAVLEQNRSIMDNIDNLKRAVLESELMKVKKSEKPTKESSGSVKVSQKPKKVFFSLQWRQKYMGWFTYKEHSRFTVELEHSKVTVTNSVGSDMLVSPISGELLIPATRITVYDPSFSVGLSTLLDYHLCVKVLNDALSEGGLSGGQSLQVESEYFRICLSPPVLFKLVELADGLKRKFDRFDGLAATQKPDQGNMAVAQSGPKKPMFTSVHVLSYNLCIGWLFGVSHKDYPGIILGAERIFAVTKADLGKLTVMDGYLSVANGTTSSSFYSTTSEVDNLNRAFMPKVQLNYYVDKNRKLWLTLKGDELDVRCMSNSTVLIERAMKSSTQVRNYFEGKSKMAELRRQNSRDLKLPAKEKSPSSSKSFTPKFSAVQCTVGFAGARVFLYKLQEEHLHEEPNSLTLQSPAVSIVVDYNHMKNAPKKHVLKAEMLMSQSDNTVYASCVPVIEDFVSTFKNMFRTSQTKQPVVARKPEKDTKTSTLGTDFGSLFAEADVHLGIRIEKQRVSLSCEPTAKVAAIVEYDGASISACSGVESFESIYVFGQINSISASLQHIYSDERSGSLLIKRVVLSSMIAFKEDIEVLSSCCISDISGYVKMKQYQDVDLFTDIWYPKTYYANVPESSEKKGLLGQSQDAKSLPSSSVSGLSVAIDFIFSNIILEVDFGPALGTMILDVDKACAISRKISSWSYEFKLGLQTLVVGSEGRLGGYLKLGGLFLVSTIEWKLDDLPLLEIPLVHMAGGFNEFQFKSIFDEHVFAFVNFKGWRFDVYNRKNGANISKDHLFVSIRYNTAEAFLTSLAASDFHDIYETVSRMIEEKRTSYKEILKDSNKESFMHRACSNEFLEVAKKLDTQIEVFTGVTTIQVYPHSFHDSKVLVVQLDRSKANFTQSEYEFGVSNQIELQLNNVKASFSNTDGTSKESISVLDVNEWSEYAAKAKGGTILGFPRFMISMRTFQKFHTNVVEYLFQSSFGGTVDIRWNLGSVNCVREMYSAHKRALLSRTEVAKSHTSELRDDLELGDLSTKDPDAVKKQAENDTAQMLASPETPHKDFDKDIQQTMEKVTSKSKFVYSALAPAIIEAPQLKELGNATPPLEWFGLHRNKFPDATHQLAIVTLQKLIHEIEREYSKMLGKA